MHSSALVTKETCLAWCESTFSSTSGGMAFNGKRNSTSWCCSLFYGVMVIRATRFHAARHTVPA
jgi:hypothetical protein